MAMRKDAKSKAAKSRLKYDSVVLHISNRPNNCFLSLTDDMGNVIEQTSCGKEGLINSKKKTAYAKNVLLNTMFVDKMSNMNISKLQIKLHNAPVSAAHLASYIEKCGFSNKITGIEARINSQHGGVRKKREKRK